jgi:hypothetical protein
MMRVELWDSDSIEKNFLLDDEKLYLILLHLQAVLGGTVSVPTLTGNVSVKICIDSREVSHCPVHVTCSWIALLDFIWLTCL